jgi:NADPH:quinone reductase-like Zn-dependent oxidoreductase
MGFSLVVTSSRLAVPLFDTAPEYSFRRLCFTDPTGFLDALDVEFRKLHVRQPCRCDATSRTRLDKFDRMRAVVFTKYGSPDGLTLRDLPVPEPRVDEVLVRVHAASLNEWDWSALHGRPWINRLIFGLMSPRRQILGTDIAGVVERVGSKVVRFKPGDEVMGDLTDRWGAFADFVCAGEQQLSLKPAGMSFEQAAALPQAGLLAWQALRNFKLLQPGKSLLINGAGGGVGTLAIQIAKSHGMHVIAVDSADKLQALRALGADEGIDYRQEDFTNHAARCDRILDVRTIRPPRAYAHALAPDGIYVTVGGDLDHLCQVYLTGPWRSRTSRKHLRVLALKPNEGLDQLCEMFGSGVLKPVIDRTFPLASTADAFRHYGTAPFVGKIVVSM